MKICRQTRLLRAEMTRAPEFARLRASRRKRNCHVSKSWLKGVLPWAELPFPAVLQKALGSSEPFACYVRGDQEDLGTRLPIHAGFPDLRPVLLDPFQHGFSRERVAWIAKNPRLTRG